MPNPCKHGPVHRLAALGASEHVRFRRPRIASGVLHANAELATLAAEAFSVALGLAFVAIDAKWRLLFFRRWPRRRRATRATRTHGFRVAGFRAGFVLAGIVRIGFFLGRFGAAFLLGLQNALGFATVGLALGIGLGGPSTWHLVVIVDIDGSLHRVLLGFVGRRIGAARAARRFQVLGGQTHRCAASALWPLRLGLRDELGRGADAVPGLVQRPDLVPFRVGDLRAHSPGVGPRGSLEGAKEGHVGASGPQAGHENVITFAPIQWRPPPGSQRVETLLVSAGRR